MKNITNYIINKYGFISTKQSRRNINMVIALCHHFHISWKFIYRCDTKHESCVSTNLVRLINGFTLLFKFQIFIASAVTNRRCVWRRLLMEINKKKTKNNNNNNKISIDFLSFFSIVNLFATAND